MANKKDELHIKVGLKIKLERTKRDLSQEKLGEFAGLSKTYLGQVERGECTPTLETLNKIAKALDISLIELINVNKVDL